MTGHCPRLFRPGYDRPGYDGPVHYRYSRPQGGKEMLRRRALAELNGPRVAVALRQGAVNKGSWRLTYVVLLTRGQQVGRIG